jgi:predicted nucleic acid-binding Zn finger protein
VTEPRLTHGGRCLTAGEVVYLLDRGRGYVMLRKPDGTVYVVRQGSCACPWWQIVGCRRGAFCKHQRFCFALGLLTNPDEKAEQELATSTQGA